MTNTRHHRFYQMFWRWCNPRTNKFEYGLNMKCAWYNIMGEEIGWGFTISNLQPEDQATLEEINAKSRLKDDVVFALLTTISLHTVAMLNAIDNLPRLDTILNGKPIGLGNRINQQIILGKIVIEKIIDRSNKVKWNLPLDATYVHCIVTSILYKIDIYGEIWANKLFPLKVCHN